MHDYKILIIDYEPRSIQALRRPLEQAGYEIHVAQDGLTGMDVFQELKPDLTLVEAMLPKKHGFEVCQELKQTPHGQRTPIAIVTGVYKGRRYRTQALHHYGCDAFLEKPIADDELLDAIKGLLKRSAGARPTEEPVEAATDEAATTAVSDGDSEAETEISDRLDDLFGDGPLARANSTGFDHGDVLEFDPRRGSRGNDPVRPDAVSLRGESVAFGNAQVAHAPAVARPATPGPRPTRPPRREPVQTQPAGRSRVFWLTMILIVTIALAVLIRIGPL